MQSSSLAPRQKCCRMMPDALELRDQSYPECCSGDVWRLSARHMRSAGRGGWIYTVRSETLKFTSNNNDVNSWLRPTILALFLTQTSSFAYHAILNMYASIISNKASSVCFLSPAACSRADKLICGERFVSSTIPTSTAPITMSVWNNDKVSE